MTFRDISFNAYLEPLEVWQEQHWSPSLGDPAADLDFDADFDGHLNLLEYAFGTSPTVSTGVPVTYSKAEVGGENYLRITVPKNPRCY